MRNVHEIIKNGLRALTAAMVVLMVTGCSAEGSDPSAEPTGTGADIPLKLGVAEVVESQTRSGSTGSIDYSVLAKSDYGFGVVASQLGWDNKQVTYAEDGTTNPGTAFVYPNKWSYGTEIYWSTISNAVDFYAYAPYVASPSGTEGITKITNTSVSYGINTTIGSGVDLLWGVKGDTGLPWEGTTYAKTGGPVLFTFRHALSAVGFRIQAMVDQTNVDTDFEDRTDVSNVLGSATHYKITVKKIELSGNFHSSGTLSLDNTTKDTPNWTSRADAATSQTLTVANGQIVESMRHPHANNETTDSSDNPTTNDAKTLMLNDGITGVTQDVQQQMVTSDVNDKEPAFMLIPYTGAAQAYTVTLYWCISGLMPDGTTYRAEDHTTTLTIPSSKLGLAAGRKYLLTFVIGLHTVGLNVTAEDWVSESVNTTVTIEHGTSADQSLAREQGSEY